MIVVNVQDDADVGGQMQESLVILTGLNDRRLAAAGFAVSVDQGQLTAAGSRPASSSMVVIMPEVVVLPWVPETPTVMGYIRLT